MPPPVELRNAQWVIQGLEAHLESPNLTEGVDLNGDGNIANADEVQEIIDTDANRGEVSRQELQTFLTNNREILTNRFAGPFATYFRFVDQDSTISPDNPIFTIFAIEASSNLVTVEQQARAFQKFVEICNIVRGNSLSDLSPRQVLQLIYDAMLEADVNYNTPNGSILSRELAQEDIEIDCDLSSMIVLAVAHEIGLQHVYLRHIPQHVFVHYNDGHETSFNIDRRVSMRDYAYIRDFGLSEEAINGNIDFKLLDDNGIYSLVYSNCASVLLDIGNGHEGVEFLRTALRYDPQNVYAYIHLFDYGSVLINEGHREELARYLSEALAFQSEHASLLNFMILPSNEFEEYNQAYELALRSIDITQRRAGLRGFSARDFRNIADALDWIGHDSVARQFREVANHYEWGTQWLDDDNFERAEQELLEAHRLLRRILRQVRSRQAHGHDYGLRNIILASIEYELGKTYRRWGRHDDAIQRFDQYIERFPLVLCSGNSACIENFTFGRTEAYLERAQARIELGPEHIRREGSHAQRGRAIIEEAINDLEIARRLDAGYYYGGQDFSRRDFGDPQITLFMGIARSRQGYFQLALPYFRQVIARDPDNQDAYRELQQAYTNMALDAMHEIEESDNEQQQASIQRVADSYIESARRYATELQHLQ